MNYRFDIQYDGTRYGGWQRQKTTDNTIQGKIEEVLFRMTGSPVLIQGAGRTDAGVHALGQVANGHFDSRMSCEEICDYMNHYLPEDIEILRVSQVSERFHSRLNAREKLYRYRIGIGSHKNVFERRVVIYDDIEKDLFLALIEAMDIDICDYRIEEKDEDKKRFKLFTKHKKNNKEYEIEFIYESEGTRKLFSLIPELIEAMRNGGLVIIDELDAKLHPKLLKYIIMLFKTNVLNRKNAQLIFTSQDLTTMNNQVFRRDEIWFACKNDDKESEIYSLYEIRNEDNEHINNGRIVKNFGAFFVASPKPEAKELKNAAILDRQIDAWENMLPNYGLVIQNYRLINEKGVPLWLPDGKSFSTSALAQDTEGRILFIFCAYPLNGYNFARAVLALPLKVTRLMYLEGGAPAALVLNTPFKHCIWNNSGVLSGFLPPSPIPNVLGVRIRK